MLHRVAAAEEMEGIAALGIDPLALLAQGLTFLVLFFIVKKYALQKIVSVLQDRHSKIDSGVRLGIKMEKEFEQLQAKIEAELHKARLDADKVIDEAQKESSDIIKAAEAKASHKVEQMLSDAEAKIATDMKNAQTQLRHELVDLVAEATEVVLEEKLDRAKDQRLIERAIAGVER